MLFFRRTQIILENKWMFSSRIIHPLREILVSVLLFSVGAPTSPPLNISGQSLASKGTFVTQQFLVLQFPQHSGSAKPHLRQECPPSAGFFPAGLFSCVGVNCVFPLQKRRTCVWAAACVTVQQLAGGNLFICKKESCS